MLLKLTVPYVKNKETDGRRFVHEWYLLNTMLTCSSSPVNIIANIYSNNWGLFCHWQLL